MRSLWDWKYFQSCFTNSVKIDCDFPLGLNGETKHCWSFFFFTFLTLIIFASCQTKNNLGKSKQFPKKIVIETDKNYHQFVQTIWHEHIFVSISANLTKLEDMIENRGTKFIRIFLKNNSWKCTESGANLLTFQLFRFLYIQNISLLSKIFF